MTSGLLIAMPEPDILLLELVEGWFARPCISLPG